MVTNGELTIRFKLLSLTETEENVKPVFEYS